MTTAATALDAVYAEMGYAPDCLAPLTLEQVGTLAVQNELRRNNGNLTETARSLGISRSKAVTLRGRFVAAMRSISTAAALLLICAHLCPSVANAQVRCAAMLLPSIAPANIKTNNQRLLHWDSSEPQFNIYTGSNRAGLVKRATVSTNAYPITNGVVYGVSSVNFAGIESTLAYWPSNRVGELVTQSSSNLATWADLTTLETFTNTPVRPRQYLRIVDRTKQWLPPN